MIGKILISAAFILIWILFFPFYLILAITIGITEFLKFLWEDYFKTFKELI